MPIILRMTNRPKLSELPPGDQKFLEEHLDINQAEVGVDGEYLQLHHLDEVEVATAARSGPSGWLVKRFFFGGQERYHVGFFAGRHEAVLPNLSYPAARYVVQTLAYFARTRIRYKGPEGLVPLSDE